MSSSIKSPTNLIDVQDTIFVIGAAVFTTLLSEGTMPSSLTHGFPIGISWFLIYRHKDYQMLIANIDSLNKKIEKQKEQQIFQGAAAKNKTQDKKLQGNETLLKEYQADL